MASVNAMPQGQSPVALPTPPILSAGAAVAGPSFVNPDDGATIVSNGDTIAAIAPNGNSLTYVSKSDSYMLQRRANGEREAGLGNGTIGVDEGNIEVAIDKKGAVEVLDPSGKWNDFGSIQSGFAQQRLAGVLDRQAFSDLTNVVAHRGSLGGIDTRQLGFAPSSIAILNYAQVMNRQEKLKAQQAAVRADTIAREQRDPPPVPIVPLENMMTPPSREGVGPGSQFSAFPTNAPPVG